MAPESGKSSAPVTRESTTTMEEHPQAKGPHPGYVSVSNQYTFEQILRRMLKENGSDPAREDSYRLQGVQLIDTVREHLQLPVRTFDTACIYYHKFRLCFKDAEYNYQDAALASLFVACKVEDTIKKSREILCAAHNIKNPDHPTTQDDKLFEKPSSIVIGLERHILETIGFDFRVRYPQKLLVKAVRHFVDESEAKDFYIIAYDMSIDMYKTFAPVKQSTFTLVVAILELTSLLIKSGYDKIRKAAKDPTWHTERGPVIETMLDLLDLYTLHPKQTRVGSIVELDSLIEIKIKLNEALDRHSSLARFEHWCPRCELEDRDNVQQPITPASATSPATTTSFSAGAKSFKKGGRSQDGTVRFVFDADEAKREEVAVAAYYKEEYEEYEVEVEEPISETEQQRRRDRQQHPPNHDAGRRSGNSHVATNNSSNHVNHDHNNIHSSHHGYNQRNRNPDRRQGRKGGHF